MYIEPQDGSSNVEGVKTRVNRDLKNGKEDYILGDLQEERGPIFYQLRDWDGKMTK